MNKLPESFSFFWKLFTGITAAELFRYVIAAGIAWAFFYVVIRRRYLHRKIISGFPHFRDVRRELVLSLLTCGVYGLVGVIMFVPIKRNWTQMYFDIHAYGWKWFLASIVITIFLHDAYFYWTHRLMHSPRLFPIMHRSHHRSTNPTPWAAYAFNPLEAFVQAGIFPLAIFLYPIHPLAFLIFMGWQITFNVLGHAGFEFHPRWFLDSRLGKFANTPTNHAMHHEFFTGNYGLYFNIWDRLMGTNHKDYETRFREVTSRPKHPAPTPEIVVERQ